MAEVVEHPPSKCDIQSLFCCQINNTKQNKKQGVLTGGSYCNPIFNWTLVSSRAEIQTQPVGLRSLCRANRQGWLSPPSSSPINQLAYLSWAVWDRQCANAEE
jgi:hypothetical protein